MLTNPTFREGAKIIGIYAGQDDGGQALFLRKKMKGQRLFLKKKMTGQRLFCQNSLTQFFCY